MQQPPLTPAQAMQQITQNLDQTRHAIKQQRSNYANSFLLIARDVATELLTNKNMDIPEAIATGIEFMEAFRDVAEIQEPKLRDATPIDPALLDREAALVLHIQKIGEVVAHQEDMLAKQVVADKEAKEAAEKAIALDPPKLCVAASTPPLED